MTTFIDRVIKANPKARRLGLSFSLGILFFSWLSILSSYLIERTQSSSQISPSLIVASILHALLLSAIILGLGLIVFGVWIGQIGIQSLRQGCYPPANAVMVCDTQIVRGWRATVKALTALMLAIASILGALGICLEILGFLNL